MSELELYKKHRPATLDAVVGNKAVVESIRGAMQKKRLPHSLLMTGPSGCGKTTVARIIADSLGVHTLDLRELNSASFRGIDTVRDIQQTMVLAPMAGTCRVWIVDECHKLTNDAQNAFLKALEDTPRHVWFILCTTDPEKLIKAIRTRCFEYRFTALSTIEIGRDLLAPVCALEKAKVPKEVLKRIANECSGSARAALVMLEKIIGMNNAEVMMEALHAADAMEAQVIDLCRALIKRQPWREISSILSRLGDTEPETVRRAVLGYMRAIMLKEDNVAAYDVACSFEKNYFDTGNAGLVLSCFEATHRKI